jgi:hypothetical protein
MAERANLFIIHSWDDAYWCHRLEELLRASDPDLAHYSLPPHRAIDGTHEQVRDSIIHRIRVATAVVVLNTPGLHKRLWADLEMSTAVAMGKRIVVVQPPGAFRRPIPAVLDGQVYRFATWRSDVVGRAIRGEYPHDDRVFELAEVADRRMLVGLLSAGVIGASFVVVVRTAAALQAFQRDLAERGVAVRLTDDLGTVLKWAAGSAVVAGLIGALTGDRKTAAWLTAAGFAVGTAVGIRRVYRIRVVGRSEVRVLAVEHCAN